jgi:hypothetical protein
MTNIMPLPLTFLAHARGLVYRAVDDDQIVAKGVDVPAISRSPGPGARVKNRSGGELTCASSST